MSLEALSLSPQQNLRLSLSTEPSRHYIFRDFTLVEFGLEHGPSAVSMALTVVMDGTDVGVSVDFESNPNPKSNTDGGASDSDAYMEQHEDRVKRAADAAVARMLQVSPHEEDVEEERDDEKSGNYNEDDFQWSISIKVCKCILFQCHSSTLAFVALILILTRILILTPLLQVLAYNRPESLKRLLASLSAADYMGHRIELHILVDGPRGGSAEDPDVVATEQVAARYTWRHGHKRITARPANFGLARQWYFAWQPDNVTEAAFILEDDVEVSPLFYRWAIHALRRYGAQGSAAHTTLLQAVRAHIARNGTAVPDDALGRSELERFREDHAAGQGVMYGLCLQKQHLAPTRYPRHLNVHNGHRPFLYQLVGTWGPLLMASPWQAFLEWWEWASRNAADRGVFFPATLDTVVNEWYKMLILFQRQP